MLIIPVIVSAAILLIGVIRDKSDYVYGGAFIMIFTSIIYLGSITPTATP